MEETLRIETLKSAYATATQELASYNSIQFAYRSLIITIVGAFFAAMPFVYSATPQIQFAITTVGLLTFVILFGVAMIAFFDYLTQEWVEANVSACEKIEQELSAHLQITALPYLLKRWRFGAFYQNLAMTCFYGASVLILFAAFYVICSYVLAKFPQEQLSNYLTTYCFEKIAAGMSGNNAFIESKIVDCRQRLTISDFSVGTKHLFAALFLMAFFLTFCFVCFSVQRLAIYHPKVGRWRVRWGGRSRHPIVFLNQVMVLALLVLLIVFTTFWRSHAIGDFVFSLLF